MDYNQPAPRQDNSVSLIIATALSLMVAAICIGLAVAWPRERILSAAALGLGAPFVVVGLAGLRWAFVWGIRRVEPLVHYDIDGDGVQGPPPPEREVWKLLPVNHSPLVKLAGETDGFSRDDLVWMIGQLPQRGISWRTGWQGATLPSGKVLTEYDDFRPFPDMLIAAGLLVNRGPRATGNLTITDPAAIRQRLKV